MKIEGTSLTNLDDAITQALGTAEGSNEPTTWTMTRMCVKTGGITPPQFYVEFDNGD